MNSSLKTCFDNKVEWTSFFVDYEIRFVLPPMMSWRKNSMFTIRGQHCSFESNFLMKYKLVDGIHFATFYRINAHSNFGL